MKDLLDKLTRATVDITLKSGEKLYDVVIERIAGNTVIANYAERPTKRYEEKCERSDKTSNCRTEETTEETSDCGTSERSDESSCDRTDERCNHASDDGRFDRYDDIGKCRSRVRKITLIDIGHIANVSAEKGIMELMKMIVSGRCNTEGGEKENKKENKK